MRNQEHHQQHYAQGNHNDQRIPTARAFHQRLVGGDIHDIGVERGNISVHRIIGFIVNFDLHRTILLQRIQLPVNVNQDFIQLIPRRLRKGMPGIVNIAVRRASLHHDRKEIAPCLLQKIAKKHAV
ncbi:hypothetical protein D3C73_1354740 [compost metagenome]